MRHFVKSLCKHKALYGFNIELNKSIEIVSCHVAKFNCSCDNVKGCVQFSPTTGSSVYATSGKLHVKSGHIDDNSNFRYLSVYQNKILSVHYRHPAILIAV